eukprot:588646-Prymnesium_polylepis.1
MPGRAEVVEDVEAHRGGWWCQGTLTGRTCALRPGCDRMGAPSGPQRRAATAAGAPTCCGDAEVGTVCMLSGSCWGRCAVRRDARGEIGLETA